MPNRRLLTVACFASVLTFAPMIRAQAQVPADGTTSPDASTQPINDLKTALPYIPWDEATHGPLIAIAPENTRWPILATRRNRKARISKAASNTETVDPDDAVVLQPLYPPTDRYGLSVERVAQHFSQKLVRLSTLSILAPPTMDILNTDLKPANPFLSAPISDRMRFLEASLSLAQWQLLGSPSGIGMSDLTKDQQDIFDAVLPPTMTVAEGTVTERKSGRPRTTYDSDSLQTLTPEQRHAVRLRLDRKANIKLLREDGSLTLGTDLNVQPVGTNKLTLVSQNQATDPTVVFGQSVRLTVPNHLKPSDLDLKQRRLREAYVPLTDVKTVADLLKAVGAKTGLELYADGRLGSLSVSISSDKQSVRAADVLEALCWSLTATYRKVGPDPEGDPKSFAYVLTYDREGLGAIRGSIHDWASRAGTEMRMKTGALNQEIRKQNPSHYLSFAANDAMRPTPEAEQALRDPAQSRTANGYQSVPIGTLSPAQRQQVSTALQRIEQQNQARPNSLTASSDRVAFQEGVGLTYILPGIGEIAQGSTWADFPLIDEGNSRVPSRAETQRQQAQKKSQEIDSAMRERTAVSRIVVGIAPKSAQEAQPVLAAAPSLGIDEVWITTPDTPAGKAMLAQCIAAGAKAGVKVGASIDLIYDGVDDSRAPALDRNIFGETGAAWSAHIKRVGGDFDRSAMYGAPDWSRAHDSLAPESPAVQKRLTESLASIATIPGVSSIVLSDPSSPNRNWTFTRAPIYEYSWPGVTFGYTVANRLAFLRQSGCDPIDLAPLSQEMSAQNLRSATTLPFYDEQSIQIDGKYRYSQFITAQANKAWIDYLAESEWGLLRSVRAGIEKAQPGVPVYLAPYDHEYGYWNGGLFARWPSGKDVPFSTDAKATNLLASLPNRQAPLMDSDVYQVSLTSGSAPSGFLLSVALNPAIVQDFALDGIAQGFYRRVKSTIDRSTATTPPGIVLDLAGFTPDETLPLLKSVLGRLELTSGHITP